MSNNYSILQKMDNVGLLKSCLIIFLIAVAARFSYAFFFIRPEYIKIIAPLKNSNILENEL